MSGSLDRSRITRLFGELSEELERKSLRGHVYVVGGAALIAGFGRERSTNDVDGRIAEAKAEVLAAAAKVGRRNGLPENWLNEKASAFLPETADERAATMFNSPGLVSSPSSAWRKLALSQPDRAQRHRELRPLPGGPHRAIDPPQDREPLMP